MGEKRIARLFVTEILFEFNECQILFHDYLDLVVQSKTANPQAIRGVRDNPKILSRIIPSR